MPIREMLLREKHISILHSARTVANFFIFFVI